MGNRRFINYALKVGKRHQSIKFFKEVLGMKVLRHEEFEEACKMSSNGPYQGKWSRTTVAYGPEEENFFAFVLIYNYDVEDYHCGNDFVSSTINSPEVYKRLEQAGYPFTETADGTRQVASPSGYVFIIHRNKSTNAANDPVAKVTLASHDLRRSLEYYNGILDMTAYEVHKQSVLYGYGEDQTKLEIVGSAEPVSSSSSFGRMGFSCSRKDQRMIEDDIVATKHKFLCPPTTLDNLDKPKVHVLLLAGPDKHHICFFEAEAYRSIACFDPEADHLVQDAIIHDQSREFHARRTSMITAPVGKPGSRRGSIIDGTPLSSSVSPYPTISTSRRSSIAPSSSGGNSAGPTPSPGPIGAQRARRSSIIM